LVPILSAKGSARMELIGSMIDFASGTAREPVTKSFCMSTTTSAGTKLVASQLREYVRDVWTSPDKALKEQALNLAVSNLFAPQPIDPKDSPVYGLYLNYLRGTKGKGQAKAKAKA